MLRAQTPIFILTLSLFLAGCGDDSPSAPEEHGGELTGSYELLEIETVMAAPDASAGIIQSDTRWFRFDSDNSYHLLIARHEDGFRSMRSGVFLATPSQINMDGSIYNHEMRGDTLVLSRPGEEIRAVRNAVAPATSDWIVPIDVTLSALYPRSADADLTWDGSYLWAGNGNSSSYARVIDSQDLSVMDSLEVATNAWAIEWYVGGLFTSNGSSDQIHRVNASTGEVTASSPGMGTWIVGIARGAHSNQIWCLSETDRTLYVYDNVAEVTYPVIDLSAYDGDFAGIAYMNGELFMIVDGVVNRCELEPFRVTATYRVPGFYLSGIAISHLRDFYFLGYREGMGSEQRIFKAAELPAPAAE